ncbi:MAG: DUF1499 domain-containing protein [Mariprofundaceae bacterium]|nr:DUF1499 domain-containing protein [Mariprofundaceae bacterium]
MKWVLFGSIALLMVGLVFFIALAVMSQTEPKNLGLSKGLLQACPDSPNCVCSETHRQQDALHFIQPIPANDKTWKDLQENIIKEGGIIQKRDENYVHATFTSSIFHYVDDVECRYDRTAKLIHVRSASRVGHSDLGANRKRIETLRLRLHP